MSGPSDRACQHARETAASAGIGEAGLIQGHDPYLGLDRSVCLRAIWEAVIAFDDWRSNPNHDPNKYDTGDIGEFIEREFGGGK